MTSLLWLVLDEGAQEYAMHSTSPARSPDPTHAPQEAQSAVDHWIAKGGRFLHLPGWLDSDRDHWQAHWWQLPGHDKLEQADWQWPRRGDWMARLDEALGAGDPEAEPRPTVLVAHSLGCQLVAAWASHSRCTHRVSAAWLVAPPDTERPDMPPQLHNWRPMPRQRLPFPALALLSTNDPYAQLQRARQLCDDWGAEHREVGPAGHLNAASGLGDWPQGRLWLAEWLLQRNIVAPVDTP